MCWLTAHGSTEIPTAGIPVIKVEATFVPPTSWPSRKRTAAMEECQLYTSKPDADNILKLVIDALNGLAWSDDKSVQIDGCWKRYGQEDYTDIYIHYI